MPPSEPPSSAGESSASSERRGSSARLAAMMYEERRRIARALKSLGRQRPLADGPAVRAELGKLVNALGDYVALTHFGAFKRVADDEERRRSARTLAGELYPRIEETTDCILRFIERYQDPAHAPITGLREHLGALARHLTERVRLEDQLLQAMFGQTVPPLGKEMPHAS